MKGKTELKKLINENNLKNVVIEKGNKLFDKIDVIFRNGHPNYEEKSKFGIVSYQYKQNKDSEFKHSDCFHIVNDFGVEETISYNTPSDSDKNKTSDVIKAFRSSIGKQIQLKKKSFRVGENCEHCDKPIESVDDLHIDHHDLEFKPLLDKYISKYNLNIDDFYKYVDKSKPIKTFNNYKLIEDFNLFHNENTTLRFLHTTCNLKK